MAETTPPGTRTGTQTGTARAHTSVVGDEALRTATGRSREEWFRLLDEQGATAWPHRDIAAWLTREHHVDAWWAQGVTVGYEQARGTRVPGQRRDGSFEASVSRTLGVDPERLWPLVADAERRAEWFDTPVTVTGETHLASVRWTLPDGSRVIGRLAPVRPGATRFTAQHTRLPDGAAAAASKAAWAQRLALLAKLATEE
jgi:hypothetical protein